MNLVRAGATNFMLWDPDVVDAVNIGVQHYDLTHIGNSKVKMLRKQMLDINPLAEIFIKRQKYDNCYWSSNFYYQGYRSSRWDNFRNKKTFVICGVDSMSARKTIVENFINKYINTSVYYISDTHFIDARMGSETFQMYQWQIMNDETSKEFLELKNKVEEENRKENEHSVTITPGNIFNRSNDGLRKFMQDILHRFDCEYDQTWYYDEDGDNEPCNARSTNYCASMAGSFINNQIRKLVDPSSPSNTNVVFNFPAMMIKCDTNYNLTK
tara:strand:+ start:2210 stop:3016 length:807 start_codon:yes stop_codon:yes gene_type:complete